MPCHSRSQAKPKAQVLFPGSAAPQSDVPMRDDSFFHGLAQGMRIALQSVYARIGLSAVGLIAAS
jgi:hypothetical protein